MSELNNDGVQDELRREIEALFARAEKAKLREITKALHKLIQQVEDPVLRRQWDQAIDALPDMVQHDGEAHR